MGLLFRRVRGLRGDEQFFYAKPMCHGGGAVHNKLCLAEYPLLRPLEFLAAYAVPVEVLYLFHNGVDGFFEVFFFFDV